MDTREKIIKQRIIAWILSHGKEFQAMISIVFVIMAFLTAYLPIRQTWRAFETNEMMLRGMLINRYFAQMNAPFLKSGEEKQLHVFPVDREEGVTGAWIVDAAGKILAPREKKGDTLQLPRLPESIKPAETLVKKEKNEAFLYCLPIQRENQVIGAAVIRYNLRDAEYAIGTGSGLWIAALLLVLTLFSMKTAEKLETIRRIPMDLLEEDLNNAIQNGNPRLRTRRVYHKLENLVTSIDRLLLRMSQGDSGKNNRMRQEKTNQIDPVEIQNVPVHPEPKFDVKMEKIEEPRTIEHVPDTMLVEPEEDRICHPKTILIKPVSKPSLEEILEPACSVDRNSMKLIDMNRAFRRFLDRPDCGAGAHIVELFIDCPEIVNAVFHMLNYQDDDHMDRKIGKNPYGIDHMARISVEGNDVLVFKGGEHE